MGSEPLRGRGSGRSAWGRREAPGLALAQLIGKGRDPGSPSSEQGGPRRVSSSKCVRGPGFGKGPPAAYRFLPQSSFLGYPRLGGGRMEKTRFFLKEVKLEVTGVKTSSCTPRERSKEAGACARGLRGGGEAWSAWDQVGRSGLWGGVQGRGLPGHGARGSELGRCGSRLLRTPRGCGQHIRHPGICPHCHAAPLPTSHPVPSPVAPPWGDPLEVHPPPSTTTCVQTQPVPGRLRRPRPGPSASRPSPSSPVSV